MQGNMPDELVDMVLALTSAVNAPIWPAAGWG